MLQAWHTFLWRFLLFLQSFKQWQYTALSCFFRDALLGSGLDSGWTPGLLQSCSDAAPVFSWCFFVSMSRWNHQLSLRFWALFLFINFVSQFQSQKKTFPKHDAATTWFDPREGLIKVTLSAWFLYTWCGELCPNCSIVISHGLRVLQGLFGKLPAGCHLAFSEEWLLSSHSTI